LKGQWIGKIKGANTGRIIINIDDLVNNYGGCVYIIPANRALPSSAARFQTKNKSENFEFKIYPKPYDPKRIGILCEWEEIKNFYQGISFPNEADVAGYFKENTLYLTRKTDSSTEIEAVLIRMPNIDTSAIKASIKSWKEFKTEVTALLGHKYIFRGQQKCNKLRTAFHRKGRYDLGRFRSEDIPLLYKRLSAKTSHVFNLDTENEFGAFLSLVQHHGYPTTLLDWTYSPYVAAFFAFRNLSKKEST